MNGVNTAPSGLTNGNGVLKKYVPPTPWAKCTVEEKIERLREQIKYVQSSNYETQNITRRLRQLVSTHKHIEGKVVEEVKEYEGSSLSQCCEKLNCSPEEAYF